MSTMPGAIVPNLGQLFTVMIDPLWPYVNYWKSGLGNGSYPSNGVLSAIFFEPSDQVFTESAQVSYASQEIIGRAEPLQVWMSTGAREVSFNFKFRVQGDISAGITDLQEQHDSAPIYIETEVIQPAKFLDALKYPIIDTNNISHGPPPVILSIGQLLQMRAIVSDASITWEYPIDVDTYLPHAASVQVTFRSVSRQLGNYQFSGAQRFVGAPLAPAASSPFAPGTSGSQPPPSNLA
jgi:hypothetical protein